MKMVATVEELRALVQLAALDLHERPPETKGGRADASRSRMRAELLARYRSLLDSGRVPAIVAIERGCCSGCHVRLPTMIESRARRSSDVHTCPHCRRMLYSHEVLIAGEPRDKPLDKQEPARRAARAAAGRRA